jgi:hypothetical protein
MAAMIIRIAEKGICADRGINASVAPRAREERLRVNAEWETEWKTASLEYRTPVAGPERLSIIRGKATGARGRQSEAWGIDGGTHER